MGARRRPDAGRPSRVRLRRARRLRAMTARAGVVLSGTGGIWRVQLAPGEVVDASLRGRLKQDRNEQLKLAVGDEVEVEPGGSPEGAWRGKQPARAAGAP